jgi:hypothetical protein
MVAMKSKEQEAESPLSERVPHLPWMRHPVDIDSFSGRPATSLPRLDPRYHLLVLPVQTSRIGLACMPVCLANRANACMPAVLVQLLISETGTHWMLLPISFCFRVSTKYFYPVRLPAESALLDPAMFEQRRCCTSLNNSFAVNAYVFSSVRCGIQ